MMFPQPLTNDEAMVSYEEFVTALSDMGLTGEKLYSAALDGFDTWLKGEYARRTPAFEYRVIYRRRGWTQTQVRLYQREHAALAFMAKLQRPTDKWAPLADLRLERRLVEARWTTITDVEFEQPPVQWEVTW